MRVHSPAGGDVDDDMASFGFGTALILPRLKIALCGDHLDIGPTGFKVFVAQGVDGRHLE